VRIGHIHLKVADLQRALDFYCGVLGFELTTAGRRRLHLRRRLSSSYRPQHLGEQRRLSPAARFDRPLPYRHSLPEPAALGRRAAPVIVAKIPLEGPATTASAKALYWRDRTTTRRALLDRPKDQWPRSRTGPWQMFTNPLTCTTCWPNSARAGEINFAFARAAAGGKIRAHASLFLDVALL